MLHKASSALRLHHDLIDVAPEPIFSRLGRLHNGMICSMEMLSGMFIFAAIATTHVPASQAHPQMHPGIAGFKALLAAISTRRYIANLIKVRTHNVFSHVFFPFEINHVNDS